MARNRIRTIPFRRSREGRTNYKKRLRLLLGQKQRLVVRLTNNRVVAQIVSFDPKGDKITLTVDSFSLRKLGWKYSTNSIPAAYLTGLLCGHKAKQKGIESAILDTGNRSPAKGGRVYAFLKGVLEAGIVVPHGEENIFPSDDRLVGKHITAYAANLKSSNQDIYNARFAKYLKNNVQPENVDKAVQELKQKIVG